MVVGLKSAVADLGNLMHLIAIPVFTSRVIIVCPVRTYHLLQIII